MYVELLLPPAHKRGAQMSFGSFIEQIIAVGINDYERGGTESAIACRRHSADTNLAS